MNVSIVDFPETKVAMISHTGSPETEQDTVMKLVQWKIQNRLLDQNKYRHYGLHYFPEGSLGSNEHKVDFCLSVDGDVKTNDLGISGSVIASCRCALARDTGSRMNNQAVRFLIQKWLPESKETLSGAPVIFHYVNVGPDIRESEAITDVYLPLNSRS